MFLNDNEEKIISIFLKNLAEYDSKEMLLLWEEGSSVIAKFDTCFEDESDLNEDDEKYEEFTTFVFELIKKTNTPPVDITEDNFFCVNYHNFPDEIIVDGKKVN